VAGDAERELPGNPVLPRDGFYLSGLDESFYDPVETPGEFALFFSRPL
jgi:hypothetical protein